MIQVACLRFCLDYELLTYTDLALFYLLRYIKNRTTFLTIFYFFFYKISLFKQDKRCLSIAQMENADPLWNILTYNYINMHKTV